MSLFGLIGRSLQHSFSKKYFTDKFDREGIAARYELFELPLIEGVYDLRSSEEDLCGLNVTIPYKEAIIPYIDHLSAAAEAIGAVNTIAIRNERLVGYNTDVVGFEQSLLEQWKDDIPSSALILGTGGASKAVRYVLMNLGISENNIFYASRHPNHPQHLSYADLRGLDWTEVRWVINTTPLGTYPDVDSKPDIPYHNLSSAHLAFDLVYNPSVTAFLAASRSYGAQTVNGYDMLVYQAEAAWAIWNA